MYARAHLSTARLSLRPVIAEDQADVVAALNDLSVVRGLSSVPYPYNRADFGHFLDKVARAGKTFAIHDARGFIGIIGIEDHLGYWLAPHAWGQGYATEAARSVLSNYFVANAADVLTGCFSDNAASLRILAKLGFTQTGQSEKMCTALRMARAHIEMALSAAQFIAALPTATSTRLTFRPPLAHDAPALHKMVSQWQMTRQLGRFPWPPDPAFTAAQSAPYQGDGFVWGIYLTGDLIGTVGITKGELGYMIDPTYHRRGFAREAVAFAIAQSNLARVEAEVWFDNAASLALLHSLGFVIIAATQHLSKARGVQTDGLRLAYTAPKP